MENAIYCSISGKVLRVEEDSYKNKAGMEVKTKKALIVLEIDGEPFKNYVTVPKGENWETDQEVNHLYKVFSTNTGFLIAQPL